MANVDQDNQRYEDSQAQNDNWTLKRWLYE
jgi:hypothetical protein